MTPSEHYQEAERLLRIVDDREADWAAEGGFDVIIARAQVHATLATAKTWGVM
jgi:hypothetical protein